MSSPPRRVAIVGGSHAGLTAAALLERRGVEVQVFEKRADVGKQMGGGIVAQPVTQDLLHEICSTPDKYLVSLCGRQFLDPQGNVKSSLKAPQLSSSWSSFWHPLRAAFKGIFHEGVAAKRVNVTPSTLTLTTESVDKEQVTKPSDAEQEFDFVIVADGGGSILRKQLLGDKFDPPTYAGYVAWRGVLLPEELTQEARELLMDSKSATFFHGDKTHILTYPIPYGDGVALNWVWYWNLPEEEFPSLLKDMRVGKEGTFSVPPGMLGEHAEKELHRLAELELPANLCQVVKATPKPFLQPIVDFRAPSLLFHDHRVALLGDAGCILRPHTAYGTAKAVEEARDLCEAMCQGANALQTWEARTLERNEDLTRYGQALGKSQQDKDAREKLAAIQGGKLDTSSAASSVIAAHSGSNGGA